MHDRYWNFAHLGAGFMLTWLSTQPWFPWAQSLTLVAGLAFLAYAAWGFLGRPTFSFGAKTKSDLMPLLELRELAGHSGWSLPDPSLHLTDLEHALNEAGVRGLVDFYARPAKDHMFDDLIKGEARQLVSREEWKNLEVSGRWIDLRCSDNFEMTLAKKEPRYGERAYADVHVDRAQAKRWLRSDAVEYKGRNQAIHGT